MKKTLILLSALTLMVSCMSKEEKMKEAEADGNEAIAVKSKLIEGAGKALQEQGKAAAKSASKGVGDVIKGINSGMSESISQSDVIPEASFKANFEECKAEKIYASNDDKVKKVTIYLIAKNDFKGDLILKAFNADKKEIGRSRLKADIKKDDAQYVDFTFDERTHLLQTEYFTIK
ncbi:hypothetical protein [Flavobacterium reichenbachii]|jgi:hypothetical protein|uniref:Lipoprotein n=1 Tax=Flavobacterium reichenbachii TaxID=362418 RepID=A0A085ZK31_9FLAO|nr:hypothetical protein [Flavobacterium reichenbachii]KFF04795.1 hypothetical protein IW19_04260 [Flavobacterium reichenbachii]OXB10306.1 hypothetical protein B0A68_22195 [Flavobacterium reichenbachii]